MLTEDDFREVHDYCHDNREALLNSSIAGCFYCKHTYPASDVVEYTANGAALCPRCHIDSVLPEMRISLTAQLLAEMHWRWFACFCVEEPDGTWREVRPPFTPPPSRTDEPPR